MDGPLFAFHAKWRVKTLLFWYLLCCFKSKHTSMIVTSARAKMNPREFVEIKDLKLGMKHISLHVIILDVGSRTLTKDGSEVRSVKVADKTASINMCVYNEPGNYLQPGDICRVIRCYTQNYKGQLTIYTGRNGKIQKVGEFSMVFNEVPNMSDIPIEMPQPQPPQQSSA